MEDELEQIRLNCGQQLQMMAECVEYHPDSWNTSCVKYKNALAECSERHAPAIREAKERCKVQISNFENCIKQNEHDPNLCASRLKDLYDCTNASYSRK
ncbi:hypothetical protein MP638_000038 [Amoeboaphelidium occidentale]|nr:hypothetical protein MP638_000038 [Amoeboaphelidium occidentale]